MGWRLSVKDTPFFGWNLEVFHSGAKLFGQKIHFHPNLFAFVPSVHAIFAVFSKNSQHLRDFDPQGGLSILFSSH